MQVAELKEKEKEIVDYTSSKNALIGEKAVKALAEKENFRQIIDQLTSEGTYFIDKGSVEKKSPHPKVGETVTKQVKVEKKRFKPEAKELSPKLRILKDYDVTGQSKSEGTSKNFLDYFRRKFELLSVMLKKRHTLSPKPIKRLRSVPKGSRVDVIGMVQRKWVTKKGHIAFRLEDTEAQCIALVLKDEAALTEEAEKIMNDDVIALKAVKWNEGMLIVKEILRPDLPIREKKTISENIAIASISDLHLGSKLFLEQPLNKFLEWINGRVQSRKGLERAGNIKYLVVSGDNVDGVGVYPQQLKELNIKDLYKQYEEFSKIIKQIPEYIEVIICPGQHDAVRRADPQPAIPKKVVPELARLSNVHFVGSPSWVEIEGLSTLIYHGAALHDLISSVSFLDSEHPEKAMIEALKRRDLMAAYGMKQPYVPEREDFMVIRREPDLVYIGDMHHNAYGNYRGATIINSGTWQGRTAFQAKLGHIPTPGVVPSINLASGKITETHFLEKEGKENEA